ncbi:MAG: hypothetical protein CMB45_02355 [Euryarchaeota archaeon]|nr:hypothetical protein [Euryarchaeota archaeon]
MVLAVDAKERGVRNLLVLGVHELGFPLLSDLDRKVIESYDASFVGLGGIEGYVCANRVVVIVDSGGVIQYRWNAENPGIEPDYDAIIEHVSSM